MHQIKQSPEDFIVKEISDIKLRESGKYAVCLLNKKNYTTMRAIEQIANILNKKTKDIGFAGTKDKKAITGQFISIKDAKKEEVKKLKLKDIELKFIGYMDIPISLGDLKENEFIITIRNLKEREITNLEKKTKKKCIMPNYFGKQRFSERNIEIGRNLVKFDFKEALRLIIESNPDQKNEIQQSLKENPANFVSALRLMPKRLLMLYVHAYQSHLWNISLEKYAKKNKKNIEIPIIGFGTEIENKEIGQIIKKIMKKEDITFRSFINRSIPEISPEGSLREAFAEIKNLKILEKGKDWVKIKFRLKKGSYATVAVDFLLN